MRIQLRSQPSTDDSLRAQRPASLTRPLSPGASPRSLPAQLGSSSSAAAIQQPRHIVAACTNRNPKGGNGLEFCRQKRDRRQNAPRQKESHPIQPLAA